MSALANAELAVMNLLWESGERMTARDIRERLYPDSTRAQHGTVQRLLQRLEEKGFLERDRRIAVHFFRPLVSREAYAGQQLESLAEKLTSGSVAPLITHLVEHQRISTEEIQRIRSILDSHTPASSPASAPADGAASAPAESPDSAGVDGPGGAS